jgi:hypothetical protein
MDPWEWLRAFEAKASDGGAVVRRGGDFDSWDIEIRAGALAGARLASTVEEHGSGRQLFRLRCRPFASPPTVTLAALILLVGCVAALSGSLIAALLLWLLGATVVARLLLESCAALALATRTLDRFDEPPDRRPAR